MWQAGAIRLAKVGNTAVEIHLTLGLAVIGGAWGGWVLYGGLSGALYGILALVLLFVSLLAHELAHGLLALKLGLSINRITVLPIGILLEIPPASPKQEILIALVGPLTNLVAGAVCGVLVYQTASPSGTALAVLFQSLLIPGPNTILFYLTTVNIVLGVFNMIPAFPMDGGRVLRAGLAMGMDYVPATQIAARLGQGLAVVMAMVSVIGLLGANIPFDPALAVVAVIVYLGAHREELYVKQQRALVHMEVKDVYRRASETISPWDVVTRALAMRLFKQDQVLPVVIEDRVVGLLSYQEIEAALKQNSPVTIAHIMRTEFPTLQFRDTLWVALRTMSISRLTKLPVVQEGIFQGVVSLNDIEQAWRHFRPRKDNGNGPLVSGDFPQ